MQVVAVNADKLTVDVLPLLTKVSRLNNALVAAQPIYDIPIFQLQRGNSAVIMMPVVNDNGFIVICDRDINSVKETKSAAISQSQRTHSRSDAIYIGGILNQTPTQFIAFSDQSITITSPDTISINAKNVTIKATKVAVTADSIDITGETKITGNLMVTGSVNAASVSDSKGSLDGLRTSYNEHTHSVSGVQSGSSTVNTSTPR